MTIEQQTILLADDSPTNLELIVKSLENDGCELVVATDGLEALERAGRARPDLILLDVMMPGLDGFEVCRRLKANPDTAEIPVIFMTSLSSQTDKLQGFAAGGVDYLTKPLQLEEVRARVQAHLKLCAMQRQLAAQNAELRANETRLRQSRDLLRAIAAQHDAKHEEERRELAHKIHEGLAQNLSALKLYVATLGKDAQQENSVAGMMSAIDNAFHMSYEMVAKLRPTVLDRGIAAALHWLAKDFEQGLGFRFETAIDEDIVLDDERATFMFRAAQELLINIALYAAAESVQLTFAADGDGHRLIIGDDGSGFDPAAPRAEKSLGLPRLAEQAERFSGKLVIDAAPGRGTKVEICLPIASPNQAEDSARSSGATH